MARTKASTATKKQTAKKAPAKKPVKTTGEKRAYLKKAAPRQRKEITLDDIQGDDESGDALTDREKLFVVAYCRHFNATTAVIEAGWTTDRYIAGKQSYTIRHRPRVAREIDRLLREERSRMTEETRSHVIKELDVLAFKGKGISKIKALELLGKYGGLFSETIHVNPGQEDELANMTYDEKVALAKGLAESLGLKLAE
jgi:hypothetical protein